ncbi:uncharacterized protein DEA37_0002466, partial [Paragonimus westermani]
MFLGVLRTHHPTLPWDPRTLMRTPRGCPKKYIGSGVYVHFGQIKGYSGYFGCDKCTQERIRVARRLTFPSSHPPLRTHESFICQSNPAHHIGDLPFCDIPIDMVPIFPLDHMHLVCLGVMKRMLNLWLFSPVDRNIRLSANSVTLLSARISNLQADIPGDFPRRYRPLAEVQRWKATEFRQFLFSATYVDARAVERETVDQSSDTGSDCTSRLTNFNTRYTERK